MTIPRQVQAWWDARAEHPPAVVDFTMEQIAYQYGCPRHVAPVGFTVGDDLSPVETLVSETARTYPRPAALIDEFGE